MQEESQIVVTGPAVLFLVLMSMLMLALPRRHAVLPLFLTATLMTLGQQFVIFGGHFTFIRILILVGWVRVLLRKEAQEFGVNTIDKVFVAWVLVSLVTGLILVPTNDQLINRSGFVYNALGSYFLVRCFVRDRADLTAAIRILIALCAVLSLFMLNEKLTGRNFFAMFGGVEALTAVREGRLRAQGPFIHPILAGTFGATLMPLAIGLYIYDLRRRWIATLGLVVCSFVTFAAASSGSLMAWVYGITAFGFWFLRGQMRAVRWALVLSTVALHLVMKAPVWFLIGRLSTILGGTGHHRSVLIDRCINNFDAWWAVGTTYTANWSDSGGLPNDPNSCDITNQYVLEGVTGGLLKLLLFIMIIVQCYRAVGGVVRDPGSFDFKTRFLFWALGCSLFSHLTSFVSVAYFDQIIVIYYALLAFIACHSRLSPVEQVTEVGSVSAFVADVKLSESGLSGAE